MPMPSNPLCPDSQMESAAVQPGEDLAAKVRRLQTDRQYHARAIEEIDKVLREVQHLLTRLHPSPEAAYPPRPPRRYQKFDLTGEESVLAFVKSHGRPTTAEVNAHWQAEGRTSVANPILARLLRRGLLQRENDPTVRGSRYHANP
jgi:hypothetical protein